MFVVIVWATNKQIEKTEAYVINSLQSPKALHIRHNWIFHWWIFKYHWHDQYGFNIGHIDCFDASTLINFSIVLTNIIANLIDVDLTKNQIYCKRNSASCTVALFLLPRERIVRQKNWSSPKFELFGFSCTSSCVNYTT